MQEVHATLTSSYTPPGKNPAKQVHQQTHDPSLASHPQTRPVIIAGLNDQARRGIPLQSMCSGGQD